MKYGAKPKVIGEFKVDCKEMLTFMYLPIKMKKSFDVKIPKRLECFKDLIIAAMCEETNVFEKYIYLTAKHVFVTKDNPGNRPGWHCDGYGTNDINYIWCDKYPTIFCFQEFSLDKDCNKSIQQMTEQAKKENEYKYKENTLLRLNEYCVHRSPNIDVPGMRTFVKISFSTEKYNLIGNSHNYLFEYNWKMHERLEVRNHPTLKEADYIKDNNV